MNRCARGIANGKETKREGKGEEPFDKALPPSRDTGGAPDLQVEDDPNLILQPLVRQFKSFSGFFQSKFVGDERCHPDLMTGGEFDGYPEVFRIVGDAAQYGLLLELRILNEEFKRTRIGCHDGDTSAVANRRDGFVQQAGSRHSQHRMIRSQPFRQRPGKIGHRAGP